MLLIVLVNIYYYNSVINKKHNKTVSLAENTPNIIDVLITKAVID